MKNGQHTGRIEIPENEWAYLAGLLDGDGCFYIARNTTANGYRPMIQVFDKFGNLRKYSGGAGGIPENIIEFQKFLKEELSKINSPETTERDNALQDKVMRQSELHSMEKVQREIRRDSPLEQELL